MDRLAERLTGAGLSVEVIETVGRYDGIVVGRIVSKKSHPGADRLAVLSVDAGRHGTLSIVSGAPKLQRGGRVALALPGAALANGKQMAAVEIRGVVSQGAVVSEQEIGLSGEAAGILEIPGRVAPGTPVSEALATEDIVVELDITPNRGDCLSILGVAREVALLTKGRLHFRRPRFAEYEPGAVSAVSVSIEDATLCPRYVAHVLREVIVAPSPVWMRMRLEMLGIRSINNVIDVTNYVLLERGQPIHAFDLDRVQDGRIVVRRAIAGERLETLDDVDRALDPGDLVIADPSGPLALAGIMGGASSAVREATRSVLLEAATFDAGSIRRTSKRLGLRSEASLRFERQVAPEGVASAAARAVELFARSTSAKPARGAVDEFPGALEPINVVVRPARVNQLLGLDLPTSEIRGALRGVSDGVRSDKGAIVCRVPSHRADLTREVDFIEEVARVIGYDRIPENLPAAALEGGQQVGGTLRPAMRRLLTAEGMNEAITLRFSSGERNRRCPGLAEGRAVKIINPYTADTTEMRRSLVPGLLAAVGWNRNHSEPWFRGFEIGTTFWFTDNIVEREMVGGVLAGRRPARGLAGEPMEETFFDAKGVVEALLGGMGAPPPLWCRDGVPGFLHPGLSALVRLGEESVGYVGALHPVVVRELGFPDGAWVFELDSQKLQTYRSRQYIFESPPRFPAIVRDLAIVADEPLEAQTVVDAVSRYADLLIERVDLFDVYRGAPLGARKKSLAVSISYRATDRTLTDEEVNGLHGELVDRVCAELPVEVRG